MDTTGLPKLTLDVQTYEEMLKDPFSIMTSLSSSGILEILKNSSSLTTDKILPSFNLADLMDKIPVNSQVIESTAYRRQEVKKIESLPKSFDEIRNMFPNINPQPQTSIVPAVSSLESARTLHETTKTQLTPLEQLLDQNFKNMHSTIQRALSAARAVRLNFEDKILSGPIHPYQKLIHKYLGLDFKTPSVLDLPVPENFCPITTVKHLNKVTDQFFENTLTHFQHLTAGIGKVENEDERQLMEGLGHGFATLSATAEGDMFVIDHKKTAEYLEFVETFRTIPISEIVNNPIQTAQRMLFRLMEIFPVKEPSQQIALPN
jgi:hypothetical protein